MIGKTILCVAPLWLVCISMATAAEDPPADDLTSFEEARNERYADQLEDWLSDWLVNQYPQHAAKAWQRDYSSMAIECGAASSLPGDRRR